MPTIARLRRALPAVGLTSAALGLVLRVVHRGPYYPGWDVIGAANGLYLVATKTPRDLFDWYVLHRFDMSLAWNLYGVPVALLPGALAARWPWEFWPHVVTPSLVALALLLLVRAIGLQRRELWFVALAIGASPTFLSYAVAGFAYASNCLPYGLALWIVLRLRERPLPTFVLAVVAVELAWHVQELGRTVFVVFLAAAALLPGGLRVRAIWLLAGAVQLWLAVRYPSFNTVHYAKMAVPSLATAAVTLPAFVAHFARAVPDLPFLLAAGLAAVIGGVPARAFWAVLLGFHLGLLFLLAANTGVLQGVVSIWPRRVVLLDFLAIGAAVSAARGTGRHARLVLGLLVVGNVWQLADTLVWTTRPLAARNQGWDYALPYTHTPLKGGTNLDSRIAQLSVDWYAELRLQVAAGRRLLLVYNLSNYDENVADPSGVLDRLYLALGHPRFFGSVYVFGSSRVRWSELPIRPLARLDPFVDHIRKPERWAGYWFHNPRDDDATPGGEKHRAEMDAIFASLARRFRLRWESSTRDAHGRTIQRFALEPW